MSYKIDYLKDKKIIQVEIQKRVNFKMVQQYSTEAIKLARENNCKKFLINHSKTLLEAGIYKIHTDGDALEQFGFLSSDKIAIVILSDKDDSHFFETADSNVKWSNFKYFNTFDNAVSWLLEDE
jgi:agmatine/peptidylarginine deiminase